MTQSALTVLTASCAVMSCSLTGLLLYNGKCLIVHMLQPYTSTLHESSQCVVDIYNYSFIIMSLVKYLRYMYYYIYMHIYYIKHSINHSITL